MKISENWLREWVNPYLTSAQLVEQLTMAGLEVDAVEPAAPALSNVVVGEVLSCIQHPNAERLKLCQLNDGGEQPVQVICGASNVEAGQKVVFARVGAELPGFKIKKAKLRGVESFGMICSEQELQLAESSQGILVLDSAAPAGVAIVDYLQLSDTLIEIDLTPNRGDCLSIAGVAREVFANNDTRLTPVSIESIAPAINDVIDVELLNQQACPHYVGRLIKGINAAAVTPLWMKEKLRRSGLRSISPVVDVTNFVMIELGQPMHGFDLEKLKGGIRVRNAQAGEKITLLDGSVLECREDTLVIADHHKALALAGIMGGLDSSVQDVTRDIMLEAAFFTPSLIAGKARSYGLHTDSSHRFERGVDPELQVRAIQRATDLLLQITGGNPGPIIERSSDANLPAPTAISLRHQRIERLLGISVTTQQVEQILSRLNMQFVSHKEAWTVTAPAYRFDINIEADLIEEVGRIIGYNNIPGTKEAAHIAMGSFSEKDVPLTKLRDALVSRGYYEAITYSFVSPELQQILHPEQATLSLSNPISSDMSEMRTRLLPGLIQALSYNLNRQQNSIKLFETGLCFIPQESALLQRNHIAGVITGLPHAENWLDKKRALDFYDIKGDLQTLMQLSDEKAFQFKPSSEPVLHPGQAADIYYHDKKVGFSGALHPSVLKKAGMDQKVYVFELETEGLLCSTIPSFTELSKFPSIRRDFALIVDQNVTYQQLVDSIKSLNNEIIQEAFVFDVYTGKEVIINRKSIALGLILQGFSRTLTDKDVDQCVASVLQILEKQYNAVLR